MRQPLWSGKLEKRGDVYYAWIFGKRRSTRCHEEVAARKEAGRLERIAADPKGHAKETATLEHAFELLIRDRSDKAKAGKGSEETVDFYTKKAGVLRGTLWEMLKRPEDSPIFLREVEPGLVDDYIHLRRKDGAEDSTIGKELTTWRASMKLAKRRGLWSGDIDEVFPVAFGGSKAKERWLTFEEVLKLYHAMVRPTKYRGGHEDPSKMRGHELFAIVAYSIATSAEWSAIWRARKDDIEPDGSFVKVHGSKNSEREREVPIQLLAFAYLLAFAREHGDGANLLLFLNRSGNFRHRLNEACDRAGIPRCSPNDLRRTHSQWLNGYGVSPQLIALNMGHKSTKMVEKHYGKTTARRQAHVQAAQIAFTTGYIGSALVPQLGPPDGGSHDPKTVRYLDGDRGETGHSRHTRQSVCPLPKSTESIEILADSVVPRDGIEPPTRGFSVRAEEPISSRKEPESAEDTRYLDGNSGPSTEPPPDPDAALKAAIKSALDAGMLDRAQALLDLLKPAPVALAPVVSLDERRKGGAK